MTHPLANDPNLDPILRRAFARVTCQIVRTYDDGSEGIINMTSRERAEAELPHYRARIGRLFDGGVRLVAVDIREVA